MAASLYRQCVFCLSLTRQARRNSAFFVRSLHQSTEREHKNADIVISGGGMVGAALACALGSEEILKNKRIILLEAGPRKPFTLTEKFDNRTCTLSPASVSLFQSIGAWDEILQMRCHPVKRMQVWESCSNSLITFNQEDMMNDLAFVAENAVILEGITRRMEALGDRLEVWYNTRTEEIELPDTGDGAPVKSWATLKLDNGKTVKTKLLIGSDGANSQVRKAANFRTVNFNYNQKAVVAVLNTSENENTVAWQRFLPTGPIAMLPLSETVGSLIWTTTPDHAKELLSLSSEEFVDSVNDAFWHERDIKAPVVRIGDALQSVFNTVLPDSAGAMRQLPPTVICVQEGSKASFPLGLCHSTKYVQQRVALVGDAAHRLHPLAGQGVNLGFGDVAELKDVLTKAVFDGGDLGAVSYLKDYERRRMFKVLPVMATIDGLQRLYSNSFTPLVLLRSLGLQATNSLPFVKDFIVKEATAS